MKHSTIANGIICFPAWLFGKDFTHLTWVEGIRALHPYPPVPHSCIHKIKLLSVRDHITCKQQQAKTVTKLRGYSWLVPILNTGSRHIDIYFRKLLEGNCSPEQRKPRSTKDLEGVLPEKDLPYVRKCTLGKQTVASNMSPISNVAKAGAGNLTRWFQDWHCVSRGNIYSPQWERRPLAFCPLATAADLQLSCCSHGQLHVLCSEMNRAMDLVILMTAMEHPEQGRARAR